MWFDGIRQPNTLYVASVSRGKDSTAMLRAIQLLGFPLDMVVSVDIWATDTIPAELPAMVEFKETWDKRCLDNFGVPVTRLCAQKDGKKLTYNDIFYRKVSAERERERESTHGSNESEISKSTVSQRGTEHGATRISKSIQWGIYGFPMRGGNWCTSMLKTGNIRIPKHQMQMVYRRTQESSTQQQTVFEYAP